MNLCIAGIGWVTPLGSSLKQVWQRLLDHEGASAGMLSSALNNREYTVFQVPADAIANAPVHPRIRRASSISRFAVVAGLAAIENAKLKINSETGARIGLIFATSNGGVIYTKRFYHEIAQSGAQAASPLLFPETVFNAPASHLAAILGLTGVSYTLVGDAAVGILALKMAEDLMRDETIDYCLVIGAEEADWLLCDAYHQWRLLRSAPPIEPFHQPAKGMILSEGAGALLLGREGAVQIETIAAGYNFSRQDEAGTCVDRVFAELSRGPTDLVVASANGTFIDQAEHAAISRHCAASTIYAPKRALGESVGASGLWQTICGAQALVKQTIPAGPSGSPHQTTFHSAIISVCGLNHQVAGLRLTLA
jgi:3-oxoacyl-(acyl-carrier-protein) synthase